MQSFQYGDVKCTVMEDATKLLDPKMVFKGRQEWKKHPELLEGEMMKFSFQSWVLESKGKIIVVDTCVGCQNLAGGDVNAVRFPQCLKEAGYDRNKVDFVVTTHCHGDHIGWNVDENGEPMFPNAKYLLHQKEYDYWNSEERRNAAFEHHVVSLHNKGLIQYLNGEHQITNEVTLLPSYGHTPGHMHVRIASGDKIAYVVGDIIHTPIQVYHPTMCPGFDCCTDDSTEARVGLLNTLASEGSLMLSPHFPYPGVFKISKEAGQFKFATAHE
eukprot:GFYU01040350.1.p1 GENE.GFYU01040350.1~~GFYU01040350.1.p1  ORF type:complete len:271 (-),score=55.91 GFYU01040350.1:160-972(-)